MSLAAFVTLVVQTRLEEQVPLFAEGQAGSISFTLGHHVLNTAMRVPLLPDLTVSEIGYWCLPAQGLEKE